MAQQNLPIHPRERLSQITRQVWILSQVGLQFGRFFITEEEFDLRLNAVCLIIWEDTSICKVCYGQSSEN